jgi:hypothetical protein
MRAMYLGKLFCCWVHRFLTPGVGSEFASDHAFRAVLCLLATTAIIWCLSWLLDFSLSSALKISVRDLQAYLIAAGAMFLVGLGVYLCT